jgi:hypothetical protein
MTIPKDNIMSDTTKDAVPLKRGTDLTPNRPSPEGRMMGE